MQDKLSARPYSCQWWMIWATFAASDLMCKSYILCGWPLGITSDLRYQPPSTANSRYIHSRKACPARSAANTFHAAALALGAHHWNRPSCNAGKQDGLTQASQQPSTRAHWRVRGSHVIIVSLGLRPSCLLLMQGKSTERWRQEHLLTTSQFISRDLMLTVLCLKSNFSFNQKE